MAKKKDNPISSPRSPNLPDSCNVVDFSTGKQQFWRFNKGKNQMKLVDVRETAPDEPIQAKHLERDTSQMWRAHCQNDAWLPAEVVFFRVLQLPLCEARELPGMVELQLDKISPLPMGQAVWTYEVTPMYRTDRGQQTVVVMIVERSVVEQYVGELEKIGYRPDRLETPVLHQVMATPQGGKRPDGAWIYPRFVDERVICTVAWWDEGVLFNITQITLTSRAHLNELTGQLTATTWAGEMEGWLTGKTDWHLVVSNKDGEEWLPILNEWAGQGVQVQKPPKAEELANVSAARANRPLEQGNLLPHDRRASYHRDDVDRVIGNTFVWGLLIYILLLVGYFVVKLKVIAPEVDAARNEYSRLKKDDKKLKSIRVQRRLLEDQLELRMTALNVLKAVAEYIPAELTLDSVTFSESRSKGSNIMLRGKVNQEHRQKLQGYSDQLAKVKVPDSRTQDEKILFSQVQPPNMDARAAGYLDWYIVCLLRREAAN